jgi:CMP-N-acetylneuraminic acid synthetase
MSLQPLAGRPMLAFTGDIVRRLDWIDRSVASTDHALVAQAATDVGLEVPFMRPADLAGESVREADVLANVLRASEVTGGVEYDVVVMLDANTPLRRAEHVSACLEKLIAGDLDAVWTVSPTDPRAHPLRQYMVSADGRLDCWDERGAADGGRPLTPVFHVNGAACAVTRECLLQYSASRPPMICSGRERSWRHAGWRTVPPEHGPRGDPAGSSWTSTASWRRSCRTWTTSRLALSRAMCRA